MFIQFSSLFLYESDDKHKQPKSQPSIKCHVITKFLTSGKVIPTNSIYINKGRSPYNGRLSDFSFYIDSQKSVHRKFKK